GVTCNAPGQTCTGVGGFETCAAERCDGDIGACFGTSWQNASFAGPCGDFARCYEACRCDPACVLRCMPKYQGACESCVTSRVEPCLAGCTAPVCMGAGLSAGCSALGACCMRLTTIPQAQCFQTQAANNDADCMAATQMYRSAGRCP